MVNHFARETVSRLKELIQAPPHPTLYQIRPYYVPGTKTFLRRCIEIYRRLSRNGAVQIFFLTPGRNIFAGKYVKSEPFLAVLRLHIVFNVK